MYCILHPDYALRSWSDLPFAAVGMGKNRRVFFLNAKEFSVLMQADGKHDVEETVTTANLLAKGLLMRCDKGERSLLPSQDYLLCDNYFIDFALIGITYRCNMKCRHCFMYPNNEPNNLEMSPSDFDRLLDNVYQCGVKNVALTGGEPLLHKDFSRVLDLITEHHMALSCLFTNGVLLDETILDRITEHGFFPNIYISYDGIGYSEFFRCAPGSEKKTLDAIKRCVNKGFKVSVNVNINEDNRDIILETLEVLENMGVSEAILIRTSESPRWVANQGRSIAVQDYYDYLIDLLRAYTSKPRHMHIRVAQILIMNVQKKTFYFSTILGCAGSCVDAPTCEEAKHMLMIGTTGHLYPCPQISGTMEMMGIRFENVLEQPIREILQEGKYADWMKTKTQERVQHSNKCRECQFREICLGGCPAISCVTPDHYGDFWDYNPWQCAFFEGKYAAKFINALPEYKCTNPHIDDIMRLLGSK